MSGWFGLQPSHQTHSRIVASCVTQRVVENTTAETPVVDLTIPGGTLETNRLLRLDGIADYLNDTTAINCWTMRAYYGGTQFATLVTTSITQGCSRAGAEYRGKIAGRNATNAQAAFSHLDFVTTAGPGVAGQDATAARKSSTHTGLTVDSTVDQTLRLTVQLSSVTGCVSWRFHALHAERVSGG